jgi:hypothetical protein
VYVEERDPLEAKRVVAGVPATPKLGEGRSSRRICAAKMASAPIVASGYSLPETIAIDVAGSIFAVSGTQCR